MLDFININEVLGYLDLQHTMSAAEFGCGPADFTVALAKKLTEGRVYAMDIQEEKLSALKSKLRQEALHNVYVIHGDAETQGGSLLPDKALNAVVIPNVLFQSQDKCGIIKEASRILVPGGQLAVVDCFKKSPLVSKENIIISLPVKNINPANAPITLVI